MGLLLLKSLPFLITAQARADSLPARLPLLEDEDQHASTDTKSGQEAMVKMTFTGGGSI